ncbi:MAG: hypothetical protein ACPL68_01420, partial [Candidatus Hydrothermia bacterium]
MWAYEYPGFYLGSDLSSVMSKDPAGSQVAIVGTRRIGSQLNLAICCVNLPNGSIAWERDYADNSFAHLIGTNISRAPQEGTLYVTGVYSDDVYQNSIFRAAFTREGAAVLWATACTTTISLLPISIQMIDDTTYYVLTERASVPSATEVLKCTRNSVSWIQGFQNFGGHYAKVFSDGSLVITGVSTTNTNNHVCLVLDSTGGFKWANLYSVAFGRAVCESPTGIITSAGSSNLGLIGLLDCSVIQMPLSTGFYPGCLSATGFTPTAPSYFWRDLTLVGQGSVYSPTRLTWSSGPISLKRDSLCTTLYENIEEKEMFRKPNILPLLVPNGICFFATEPQILSLYSPTGALIHRENLVVGKNLIILPQGVYLWQAGPYKGKAVV